MLVPCCTTFYYAAPRSHSLGTPYCQYRAAPHVTHRTTGTTTCKSTRGPCMPVQCRNPISTHHTYTHRNACKRPRGPCTPVRPSLNDFKEMCLGAVPHSLKSHQTLTLTSNVSEITSNVKKATTLLLSSKTRSRSSRTLRSWSHATTHGPHVAEGRKYMLIWGAGMVL